MKLCNILYSKAVLWIRIRIPSKDPDPYMQIEVKMEVKDVRFKILINNSEDKNFFRSQFVLIVKKIYFFHRKLFFSKIILNFSFKIDCITLDPDPNWA